MNKEILRLAIPNIISNISVPLLSTVDTALMGRLSALHIGAVGISSMLFNFIYWNFGFLRMGTTGITAQAFGKEDVHEMANTLGRAVAIALLVSIALMVLQVPIVNLGIQLMNVPEDLQAMVKEYFYIRIWAAPASLLLYVLLGWFFGLQNALYPLWITILINGINIVLSYLFIVEYQMDIAGVAWSTVVAQYSGLLLASLFIAYRYRKLLHAFEKYLFWRWSALQPFLSTNSNLFIRTVCLTFAFGFFYSQSANLGPQLLAVNVILLQFLNWMSYGIDGFAFASESLVGKYHGAQDLHSLRKAVRYSFAWGGVLSLLFCLSYWGLGSQILSLFTTDGQLIALASDYLIWIIIMPVIAYPSYLWDGVFIGLTAAKSMRDSMVISLVLFMLVVWLTPLNAHWLWGAFSLFLLLRGVIQSWLFYRYRWSIM